MPKLKLTKRNIDALPAPEKAAIHWDADLPGFGLRVMPSGVKTYLVKYRASGQQRKYSLGKHGAVTPDQARKTAQQALAAVARGEDPAAQRQEQREAPTVAVLAADYMERHAIPNKRPASVRDDQKNLDRFILPALGNRKVAEVNRREIEQLRQSLKATPVQGNRVLALASKMFSIARQWEWCEKNPVELVQRFPEGKRDRWLRDEEVQRLLDALADYPDQNPANAIRLLLLTGARKSEVLRATWDQFDMERGVWTKPSHHTKQKKTEHVPLSAPAMALLAAMSESATEGVRHLVPGRKGDTPRADLNKPWRAVRAAAGLNDVRLHDLRHTYASHLVSAGEGLAAVGRLLGHTQPQTTARYAHLADDPLRAATDRIGAKFAALAEGKPKAEVVSIETAKKA